MAKKSTNDADFIKALRAEREAAEPKPDTELKHEPKAGMIMNHPPAGPGKSLEEMLRDEPLEAVKSPVMPHGDPIEVEIPSGEGEVGIPVDLIDLSPYQPRLKIDEDALRRLAESIAADGQINPIVVRKIGSRYELIGGERRWRAISQILHLPTIKAVIKALDDADAAVMALTDNEAREDLSDYERARKYKQLLDDGTVSSQSDLARRTGKDRAFINRCMAFFRLPVEVTVMLNERPDFISAPTAGFFATFMDPRAGADADLVLDAIRKIYEKHLDATNALNWLKGQVKARHFKAPVTPNHQWVVAGKTLGNMKIEGRKLVISCAAGVTPDEIMNRILLAASE